VVPGALVVGAVMMMVEEGWSGGWWERKMFSNFFQRKKRRRRWDRDFGRHTLPPARPSSFLALATQLDSGRVATGIEPVSLDRARGIPSLLHRLSI
jgi:hypothetical protein